MAELIEFLDNHGRVLLQLLYRVTMREDVSEDLMQELFLKLKASDGFRSAENPLAYARRTALHLAFDWRRNRAKMSGAELPHDNLTADEPSPLARLIERERIQEILDTMAGLSSRDCELLTMHYIQEVSYEVLAKEHEKTPHQIRAICHKALNRLRDLMTENSHGTVKGDRS